MKRSDKDPRRSKAVDQSEPLAEEVGHTAASDDVRAEVEGESAAGDDSANPGVAGDATGSDRRDAAVLGMDSDRRFTEQQDRYLRLAAEYDNFRKRSARERQDAAQRGQAELLRDLLDPLDDLTRFAHVDPTTTDTKTVVDGVAMVERKMLKVLTALGLEVVNPVDQSFDPSTMEAVATEPALAPEDDHVVSRVFQLGYRFKGQLLRPARVVVKQWNG
jgi:molecular chaperone GrpE